LSGDAQRLLVGQHFQKMPIVGFGTPGKTHMELQFAYIVKEA
jgi:hypothetical protein